MEFFIGFLFGILIFNYFSNRNQTIENLQSRIDDLEDSLDTTDQIHDNLEDRFEALVAIVFDEPSDEDLENMDKNPEDYKTVTIN